MTLKGVVVMPIRRPTIAELQKIAHNLNMNFSDAELKDYLELMEGNFQAYDDLEDMEENLPEVKYPRSGSSWPTPEDNVFNAWYVKTDIKGSSSGKLSGKRIVLKDNICLAGVPMMNGASTLRGYVPDIDATIVTRILDASGTIVGKANCEYFCLSGGSHTCANGPIHNPWRKGFIAGGSSSGCSVLVSTQEVDMAIGCDQGGSIRIPSALCGTYGMKPTFGLVTYTGIMPIEATLDYAGPITSTVADNALLLEVIAGVDEFDPRQKTIIGGNYTQALEVGIKNFKIGVLSEGFQLTNMEPDVADKVIIASEKLRKLGATVENVSIPQHASAMAIWTPIILEGLQMQMMHGNATGFNWKGLYNTSLLLKHKHWREQADDLSPSLKISMLVGEYSLQNFSGYYYAKAQNLSRKLTAAYDKIFQSYDLLLMPTLPIKAKPIPDEDASLSIIIQRAFEMIGNTAPFNVTGHPAMTIPCGLSDGLPIGMMLVAPKWKECSIYSVAHSFEQCGDWRSF